GGKGIARGPQLLKAAPDHRAPGDGGRGLAKRAGPHLLREFRHPAIVQHHIRRQGRSAERRAFPRAALRGGQAAQMRDIRRQRQDAPGIEPDQIHIAHRLPSAWPYVIPVPPAAKEKPMAFDPASLKFDAQGLIPCIAQDHSAGEVLMLAWMNADAVARTLETGKVSYWSRSRPAFWVKVETSG